MENIFVDINMTPRGIAPRIHVSQYDKGRTIECFVYTDSTPYEIPEGALVTVEGTKADNKGFQYECTYSGSNVYFEITDQMTMYEGEVETEIVVYDGNKRYGSANFILDVEIAGLQADVDISKTDLPLLEQIPEIRDEVSEIRSETKGYRDETKDYMDNAKSIINSEKEKAIEEIDDKKELSLEDVETAKINAINLVNAKRGEAQEAIAGDRLSAQEAIASDRAEAISKISVDRASAIKEIGDSRIDALNAIATDKKDATDTIAVDKKDATDSISSAKSEALDAISTDRADAQGAIAKDKEDALEEMDEFAKLSESYAKGGTGAREGEDTDNSKYYKDRAEEYAKQAQALVDVGFASDTHSGLARGDGETIHADGENGGKMSLTDVYKEHPSKTVRSESGVHDFRVFEGEASYWDGNEWVQVSGGAGAQLAVSAPEGSRITLSGIGKPKTLEGANVTFKINDYGTYTVTCENSGFTVSQSVEISVAQLYTLTMEYKVEIPTAENFEFDYSGEEQAPTINYNPDFVNVSGEKGVNAGEYNLLFELKNKDVLKWNDGSSRDFNYPWKINKVANPATLSKDSVSLNDTDNTDSVELDYSGDGEISITKNSPQFSVEKNVRFIVVTKEETTNYENDTVTVTITGDTNYLDKVLTFGVAIAQSFRAKINVTYPMGSLCKLSLKDGTKEQVAEDKSGSWVFTVREAGTWVVVITDGDLISDPYEVEIISETQTENVTMKYFASSIEWNISSSGVDTPISNVEVQIKYDDAVVLESTSTSGVYMARKNGEYTVTASDANHSETKIVNIVGDGDEKTVDFKFFFGRFEIKVDNYYQGYRIKAGESVVEEVETGKAGKTHIVPVYEVKSVTFTAESTESEDTKEVSASVNISTPIKSETIQMQGAKINVTYPEGSELTAPLNTYFKDGAYYVWEYGRFTFTISDGEKTESGYIDIAENGEYRLTLDYFKATIKATYTEGATCELYKGEELIETAPDTSGSYDFIVRSEGNYKVKITKDVRSAESDIISIVSNGQVANVEVSVFKATIRVTYFSGTTCQLFKGSQLIETATRSPYDFVVYEAGADYVVKSSEGSDSKQYPVAILTTDEQIEEMAVIPINVVPWATGSDSDIVKMVAYADAGLIKLTDYWEVEQERTMRLSAMDGIESSETHLAQDVVFVLMNNGGKTLTNGKECSFIVGMKNCLAKPGKMNIEATNEGSWGRSTRRAWANTIFRAAIPQSLRSIFKEYENVQSVGGISSSQKTAGIETVNDYFSFPAQYEVYGNGNYSASDEIEALAGKQWEYYKTESNRAKNWGGATPQWGWWQRSPANNDSLPIRYCLANKGTWTPGSYSAIGERGLSLVGCI